jgi:hypothetical protein
MALKLFGLLGVKKIRYKVIKKNKDLFLKLYYEERGFPCRR